VNAGDRPRARFLLVVATLIAGCVPAPVSEHAADTATAAPLVSPSAVPVSADTPAVRAASPERVARRTTVRVRSLGCGRIGTASAVAVGRRLLVTNRHVVAGADRIELNYWDGSRAEARPRTVAVADDLALVEVSRRLPAVARVAPDDASKGAELFVVGFPNGGQQTIARGELIEYAPLERHPDASPVMRLSAPIAPGNSGGPVLDASGAVIGVVFGIETATGHGLAVPASAVLELLEQRDAGGSVPSCP
jgi:S1-C subfamily serine protease